MDEHANTEQAQSIDANDASLLIQAIGLVCSTFADEYANKGFTADQAVAWALNDTGPLLAAYQRVKRQLEAR